MSGKHAKSVFYQDMYIINVFHVILYIKIYFAQTRLCIVIVVNRRSDLSNAIPSEISMDRKLAWVENCTGNYTDFYPSIFCVSFRNRVEFHKRGPTPKRKLSADDKVAHKRRYNACERKREFQPH